MVGLGNSKVDLELSIDEGDMEEVVWGVVLDAKKRTIEEDQ